MKFLIVLTFCFAACLAHGVSNGGNGNSGGFRSNRGDSNLIDYPFTVETRTISGGSPQGHLGRSNNNYQPQQRQTIAQPNYSQNNQWSSSSIGGGSNNIIARARTQYVEIPVIVETVRSQPQQIRPQSVARNIQFQSQPQIRQQPQQQIRQQPQPQFRQQQAPVIRQQQAPVIRQQQAPVIRQQQAPVIRQQQPQYQAVQVQRIQPQPQIRQQQRSQPSFQIERSYPVASFELPVSRGSSNNNVVGGFSNTQSSSRSLIDYPFTVEVSRSSGSSGFNSGFSRNTGGNSW